METVVMNYIRFAAEKEFIYHWCGKFVAPDEQWVHLTRHLTDYELFVVTDGTLHIASTTGEYTVSAGEYLLMPPNEFEHGTKPSHCIFYWMHFGYNKEQNDHDMISSDTADSEQLSYAPGHILLPEQGRLSSADRIIILMKQLQDLVIKLRFGWMRNKMQFLESLDVFSNISGLEP